MTSGELFGAQSSLLTYTILPENVSPKLSAEIYDYSRTHFKITTTLSSIITIHSRMPFQSAVFPLGLHRSKGLTHPQPLIFLKCPMDKPAQSQKWSRAGDLGGGGRDPGKAKGHLRLEKACDDPIKSSTASLSPGFNL